MQVDENPALYPSSDSVHVVKNHVLTSYDIGCNLQLDEATLLVGTNHRR